MPLSKKPIVDNNTISYGTSESWNVADGYMKLKVLKFLIDADRYLVVAQYGSETMEDSEVIPPQLKTYRRIEGISRLKDSIVMICENSSFAIQKKEEKEKLNKIKKHLDSIEQVMPGVSSEKINMASGEEVRVPVINEEHFSKVLKALRKIKEDINEILNEAGLIFRHSDEMDLDEIEKQILEYG